MRIALVSALLLCACGSPNDKSPAPNPGNDPGDTGVVDDDTNPPPVQTVDGYPVGPYGLKPGLVFPNVTLMGYVNGAGGWTSISTKDYFDPDGAKGVDGVMITVSAPWCSGCTAEGSSLPGLYASKYQALGAKFLAAVVQDESSRPATRATVDAWVAAYKTNYDIAADPGLLTVRMDPSSSGSLALPLNYVVDPRTMRVKAIDEGIASYGAEIPGLDAVLQKNRGG